MIGHRHFASTPGPRAQCVVDADIFLCFSGNSGVLGELDRPSALRNRWVSWPIFWAEVGRIGYDLNRVSQRSKPFYTNCYCGSKNVISCSGLPIRFKCRLALWNITLNSSYFTHELEWDPGLDPILLKQKSSKLYCLVLFFRYLVSEYCIKTRSANRSVSGIHHVLP